MKGQKHASRPQHMMTVFTSSWFSNDVPNGVLLLLLWTVTSFLCHFTGKAFLISIPSMLHQDEYPGVEGPWWLGKSVHACLLTVLQMVMCYFAVQVENNSEAPRELFAARFAHVLATFATNLSMAFMFASSTFAIKLMEPITSAITQYLILGTPLSPVTILTLPVIVGGAILFAGNPLQYSNTSLGAMAALLSNIILALRNIAMKTVNGKGGKSGNVHLNGRSLAVFVIFGLLVSVMADFLEERLLLPVNSTYTLAMGWGSALFHVTYSYVSIGMVLTKMSVVSHAVANILKRTLVVLLLYAWGQRVATSYNWLGLGGCIVGLLVYVWDKKRHGERVVHKDIHEKRSFFHRPLPWKLLLCGLASLCVVCVKYGSISSQEHPKGKDEKPVLLHSFNRLRELWAPDSDYYKDDTNDHGNTFSRNTFSVDGLLRPSDEELRPITDDFPDNVTVEISSFLERRLINDTWNSNFLSTKLTRASEIIREAQRLHFNILEDLLKKYKYAMLFDIAAFENKGDPCITVGEIYFLRRMNIKIVYYCSVKACTQPNLDEARKVAHSYSPDELVILGHGGGNIIGYRNHDVVRYELIKRFSEYQIVVFPQSIWMKDRTHYNVKTTIENYCCHPNLTLILRDRLSYQIAQELYNGSSTLLMAPDMAFQIGSVKRYMSPVFDILWLKRADGETPGYSASENIPRNLRVHVSDWLKWGTPRSENNLEKAFYIAANGFAFLQRGRVIITDRLHGHILSTLMDIPHVLIDNKAKKLSSYHNTWTQSLHNTIITDNPAEALELAIGLMEKYKDSIPVLVPYLNVSEDFRPIDEGHIIAGYP